MIVRDGGVPVSHVFPFTTNNEFYIGNETPNSVGMTAFEILFFCDLSDFFSFFLSFFSCFTVPDTGQRIQVKPRGRNVDKQN